MLASVVICTYRRPEPLRALLESLAAQTHSPFEVLVIDGSGATYTAVRDTVRQFGEAGGQHLDLRHIATDTGLTLQRNVGLREARGEVVCFFDDDVTFGAGFLAQAVAWLERDDTQDVGGLAGYDVLHYGKRSISLRHRLYKVLGLYTSLTPGALGRAGLKVPLAYQPPFHGCLDVGWLEGLCMIYRHVAVEGLWFDEGQPSKGADDVDFSSLVGRRWRLVLWGDLLLAHHHVEQARPVPARSEYEAAYGLARMCLRRPHTASSELWLLWYAAVEFAIDGLSLLRHPSWIRVQYLFARPCGLVAGIRSVMRERAHGRGE